MGGLGSDIGSAEAVSALEWWLEAGVDVIAADRPRNWLADVQTVAPPPAVALDEQRQPIPETLALFRQWIASSPAAPLAGSGSKGVLPKGEPGAEVMLLADCPGREEITAGSPIAGESWELTKRMLAAIGINPDEAYFANLACFYSPGPRLGRDQIHQLGEVARRHVALATPNRLLLLGDAPAQALLGKTAAQARGHVHRVEGIRTIATVHPRMLLDRPSEKARAWKDLLLLMEVQP